MNNTLNLETKVSLRGSVYRFKSDAAIMLFVSDLILNQTIPPIRRVEYSLGKLLRFSSRIKSFRLNGDEKAELLLSIFDAVSLSKLSGETKNILRAAAFLRKNYGIDLFDEKKKLDWRYFSVLISSSKNNNNREREITSAFSDLFDLWTN